MYTCQSIYIHLLIAGLFAARSTRYTVNMIVTAMTAVGCTMDRLAAVQTNRFLPADAGAEAAGATDEAQPDYKVIAARVFPRDEMLLKDVRAGATAAADSDPGSWELRAEVIRVGLAAAVATFDALSAAQQEALYKVHADEHLDGLDGLSPRDVQAAVQRVLPGELAKHAIKDSTKAVTRCASAVSTMVNEWTFKGHEGEDLDDMSAKIQEASGLTVDVLEIANTMRAFAGGTAPSVGAAVYLAAVVDYLLAELLEVSGNVARDVARCWIHPRDVCCAVNNDEELTKLYLHDCTIMDGGVLPNIHVVFVYGFDGEGEGDSKEDSDGHAYVHGAPPDGVDDGDWASYLWRSTQPKPQSRNPWAQQKQHGGAGVQVELDRREALEEMAQSAMLSVGAAWINSNTHAGGGGNSLFTPLSKKDQGALLATAGSTGSTQGGAEEDGPTYRDSIQGITKSIVFTLAARAGCLALSTTVIGETRRIVNHYLEVLLRDAITITAHGGRNVVLAADVLAIDATRTVLCGTGQFKLQTHRSRTLMECFENCPRSAPRGGSSSAPPLRVLKVALC